MKFRKQGAIASTATLAIVLIIIAVFWIINESKKECKKDSDCGSEQYCGSDFACHNFKVIEKTTVNYDFTTAGFILGFAIIIAALILKKNSFEKLIPKERDSRISDFSEEHKKKWGSPQNFAEHEDLILKMNK